MEHELYWDAIYEIVLALIAAHPEIDLERMSLESVFKLTVELPGFRDDPELANDEILMSIFQEWYEEKNSV